MWVKSEPYMEKTNTTTNTKTNTNTKTSVNINTNTKVCTGVKESMHVGKTIHGNLRQKRSSCVLHPILPNVCFVKVKNCKIFNNALSTITHTQVQMSALTKAFV